MRRQICEVCNCQPYTHVWQPTVEVLKFIPPRTPPIRVLSILICSFCIERLRGGETITFIRKEVFYRANASTFEEVPLEVKVVLYPVKANERRIIAMCDEPPAWLVKGSSQYTLQSEQYSKKSWQRTMIHSDEEAIAKAQRWLSLAITQQELHGNTQQEQST